MAKDNLFSNLTYKFFREKYARRVNKSLDLGNPRRFLIIRQHNQLGDLLATVPLFRAIKEKYPGCFVAAVFSPVNYQGLVKNKYLDEIFIFDKKKLFVGSHYYDLKKFLKKNYDVVIVPAVVSVSFTSNLLGGMSDAKIKIGPKSLNGSTNKSSYFFDRRVDLDWRQHPDMNVYERILDIVRPFGITTNNFRAEIYFDENDIESSKNFVNSLNHQRKGVLVGFHVGAGKKQNRWSLSKFITLAEELSKKYDSRFYLTGSKTDIEEIMYVMKNSEMDFGLFINKKISEVAALISLTDLFVTNDTGIMHVAGATNASQISLFGATNPLIWAPFGKNKYFIRKSILIDDITVQDVLTLAETILDKAANGK
jgi:heptosyltransferase-2